MRQNMVYNVLKLICSSVSNYCSWICVLKVTVTVTEDIRGGRGRFSNIGWEREEKCLIVLYLFYKNLINGLDNAHQY